jgi:hypothetical protein
VSKLDPKHLRRLKWSVILPSVLLVGLAMWLVVAIVTARASAGPIGEVVQSIGRLEPFMRSMPSGSVVVKGPDTVAVLESYVEVEPGQAAESPSWLWRGRWLESAPSSLHTDTTLVGVVDSVGTRGSALIILLEPRSTGTDRATVGVVTLQPSGHSIPVLVR